MTLDAHKVDVSLGIQHFAGQIEEGASASLYLLRDIDQTVSWLNAEQRKLTKHLGMAHWLYDALEKSDSDECIDPEDELDILLQRALDGIQGYVSMLTIKQRAAFSDTALCGDHEDSVVTAYQETINLASDLFDTTEGIRIYIREFDADVSGVPTESYRSSEELLAALDAEDD